MFYKQYKGFVLWMLEPKVLTLSMQWRVFCIKRTFCLHFNLHIFPNLELNSPDTALTVAHMVLNQSCPLFFLPFTPDNPSLHSSTHSLLRRSKLPFPPLPKYPNVAPLPPTCDWLWSLPLIGKNKTYFSLSFLPFCTHVLILKASAKPWEISVLICAWETKYMLSLLRSCFHSETIIQQLRLL